MTMSINFYLKILFYVMMLLTTENSKTGDPTEIALLEAGVNYNIFKDDFRKKHIKELMKFLLILIEN